MERYETIKRLATGSYGSVYMCKDKHSSVLGVSSAAENIVAVKVFLEASTNSQVLKSSIREATLLQHCKGHPNIVQLHQAYRSDSGRVYLVMEYIPRDLGAVTYDYKSSGGVPPTMIWSIARQLLQGIRFLHKQQIMHRDLKPANVMLTADNVVKIIDLGLARQVTPSKDQLTEYIQTRWYRAPELMVPGASYSFEIDIWALGCIIAEMIIGKPLFPGKNHLDQLQLILDCFGVLPKRFMADIRGLQTVDQKPVKLPKEGEAKGLRAMLPDTISSDLLEFISLCLTVDPLRRPTAEQLLLKMPKHCDNSAATATGVAVRPTTTGSSLTPSAASNSTAFSEEHLPIRSSLNKARSMAECDSAQQPLYEENSAERGIAAQQRQALQEPKLPKPGMINGPSSLRTARLRAAGLIPSITVQKTTSQSRSYKVNVTRTTSSAAVDDAMVQVAKDERDLHDHFPSLITQNSAANMKPVVASVAVTTETVPTSMHHQQVVPPTNVKSPRFKSDVLSKLQGRLSVHGGGPGIYNKDVAGQHTSGEPSRLITATSAAALGGGLALAGGVASEDTPPHKQQYMDRSVSLDMLGGRRYSGFKLRGLQVNPPTAHATTGGTTTSRRHALSDKLMTDIVGAYPDSRSESERSSDQMSLMSSFASDLLQTPLAADSLRTTSAVRTTSVVRQSLRAVGGNRLPGTFSLQGATAYGPRQVTIVTSDRVNSEPLSDIMLDSLPGAAVTGGGRRPGYGAKAEHVGTNRVGESGTHLRGRSRMSLSRDEDMAIGRMLGLGGGRQEPISTNVHYGPLQPSLRLHSQGSMCVGAEWPCYEHGKDSSASNGSDVSSTTSRSLLALPAAAGQNQLHHI